ncbi:metal ABC transporter solute-binding protein, Zn/Mn family [Tomitella fengzijianii]|uniref:ABC transporter permease n=1 Tax=Tomitella fengzijianii TaxID=2597660 RepID=A0A516X590_9ACTN|nr:zinc ABC transporter substrate-binding protein [Tomitella fengzijianii]QDQ98242.1 ABC transporter permease [Tomitella fengzijianii]
MRWQPRARRTARTAAGRRPHAARVASAAVALTALAAAGCASAGTAPSDGRISVVASTPVWAEIAEQIGGSAVDVRSIVPQGQDPHEFQVTPTDALAVDRADVLVANGGGYDAFFSSLLRGVSATAPLIDAAELHATAADRAVDGGHAGETDGGREHADEHDDGDGHDHDQGHGHGHDHGHDHGAANEHLWFDLRTVDAVAADLAGHLARIVPAEADAFHARADALHQELQSLEDQSAAIAAGRPRPVIATEPVAHYLLAAAGIEDLTPPEFGEAIEHGSDPAPAVIARLKSLLAGGDVAALVYNTQTDSPTTEAVLRDAERAGLPVVEVAESPPDGIPYTEWVHTILTALGKATAR